MKIKITQYGLSVKAGGWDASGDTLTDKQQGNNDNHIDYGSCAMTVKSCDDLGVPHKDGKTVLRIDFGNDNVIYRRHDDTAPESEARVDCFQRAFDKTWPDYAEVTVCRL